MLIERFEHVFTSSKQMSDYRTIRIASVINAAKRVQPRNHLCCTFDMLETYRFFSLDLMVPL